MCFGFGVFATAALISWAKLRTFSRSRSFSCTLVLGSVSSGVASVISQATWLYSDTGRRSFAASNVICIDVSMFSFLFFFSCEAVALISVCKDLAERYKVIFLSRIPFDSVESSSLSSALSSALISSFILATFARRYPIDISDEQIIEDCPLCGTIMMGEPCCL